MRKIVVAGTATSLGERVASLLGDDPAVDEVVSVGSDGAMDGSLDSALAGASALVDVGPLGLTRNLLAVADGVSHIVHLSSATVYGAWPDNSVPLSEEAPLRPNPGFRYAAECAEAERLVLEWKDANAGATASILRPTVVVGPGSDPLLSRALSGAGLRSADAAHPAQCVHGDDVVSALLLALRNRIDGVFNVAPDGWMADDTARALAGGPARMALPERVVRPLRAVLRAFSSGDALPGVEPYRRYPWVVASDKLRAAGWHPEHTNEEALVLGAGSARELSPKRRQELALAAAAAGIAGVGAGVIAVARRARKR